MAMSLPKSSELISSRAPLKSPFRCSLSSQPARTKGRIPLLRRAHHDIGLHSKVYLERLVQRARIPRAVELSPLLADLFFRSVALCRRKRRGRKKVQRRKKKKSDFSPLFSFFRRPSLQSVSLFLCLPSIFSSLRVDQNLSRVLSRPLTVMYSSHKWRDVISSLISNALLSIKLCRKSLHNCLNFLECRRRPLQTTTAFV